MIISCVLQGVTERTAADMKIDEISEYIAKLEGHMLTLSKHASSLLRKQRDVAAALRDFGQAYTYYGQAEGETLGTALIQVNSSRRINAFDASCPQYLDIEPAFDDLFVMSYVNGANHDSAIAVMALSAANKGIIVSTTGHSGEIYEIATISQDRGVFVAITQDSVAGGGSSVVFAGKVGTDGKTIAFGADAVYCTDEYSLNPSITRLSETEFALSYYCTDGNRQVVSTRAGVSLSMICVCE